MATKSKNIKYSPVTKLAAIVLAVVMFACSGLFANQFIRGVMAYSSYDKISDEYTRTSAFRDSFGMAELNITSSAESNLYSSVEEYLNSEEGKAAAADFDKRIAEVTQAYDLLANSGIEVYVTESNSYRYLYTYKNLIYCFNYSGELVDDGEFLFGDSDYKKVEENTETTTAVAESNTQAEQVSVVEVTSVMLVPVTDEYGNVQDYAVRTPEGDKRFYNPYRGGQPPLEVQDIGEALRTISTINGYTAYGESTKERFLQELQAEKTNQLNADYNNLTYNWYEADQIKSVNYAVFFKNGKVATNCGVTAKDTQEQILQKLGGEFIEGNIGGKYTLFKGKPVIESENIYGQFNEMITGSNSWNSPLSGSHWNEMRPNITAAYFSYAPDEAEADPFVVSQMAWQDFGNFGGPSRHLALFALSFLLACAACIYLLSVAGKTADGIKINFYDKIPFEINLVLGAGVMFLSAAAAVFVAVYECQPFNLVYAGIFSHGFLTSIVTTICTATNEIVSVCFAIFFTVWTAITATFIRNIRNKSFWKHTLCYQILRLAGWILKKLFKLLAFIFKPFSKLFKKIGRFCKKQIDKIKFILTCDYAKGQGKKFKVIACVFAAAFVVATIIYYFVATLFMAAVDEFLAFLMFFFGILGDLAILLFVLLLIVSLDRIMQGVSDMRSGNLNSKIDMQFMPGFMRRFAEDILSMQDGLQNAVDSAIKDQKMKAELITNVSHDLKTPLTSIVNYVDLLKKCDVQDETAQKYISVLDEKAARMKKLIEDLVEASKASSGAIEIHPVKINLCEFAAQAVGEHEDELAKYNIGLVLKAHESPINVIADSQKTSRIVENLFSNIRKYALEGTRVYVEVYGGEDYGTLVIKNISKYPLDVSAEELTQRFVRGDASRSGEGSGLGLSIAQNLCELQKGKFKVDIDGDLFKVTVALPKAE